MKIREYIPSFRAAWALRQIDIGQCHAEQDCLPVIVTLTSIPSRLGKIHLTIRSLLNQTKKPERIVLWLNHALTSHIPASLQSLVGEKFEIRFEDMTSSHRKLVFSLREFPDSVLVTCDDDGMYPSNWLEHLFVSHQANPDDIIANAARLVSRSASGDLLPYSDWPYIREPGYSAPNLLPIGRGGVLYPPHSLHPDATRADLFLSLTPTADDLWFKAMAVIAQKKHRLSDQPYPLIHEIVGSQMIALKRNNISKDANRDQWQSLAEHYELSI